MKKGFDRLRGVAAASAMGLGMLGAGMGTLRAATTSTRTVSGTNASLLTASFTQAFGTTGSATVSWGPIGNINYQSVSTTTGGYSRPSSSTAYGITEASISSATFMAQSTSTTSSISTTYTTSSASLGDAFDNTLNMAVGNVLFVNPDTTVDLTGTTVTSDVVNNIAPGLDAQIQYSFHPNRAVVRAIYTLTNTTGAEIMTPVTIMGNMGSDGSTLIQATSDGDTINEASDTWIISGDYPLIQTLTDVGDPIITTTRYGTGAPVVPANGVTLGMGNDNWAHRYDLTIPAMETQRIMVFHELHHSEAGAIAGAASFESLEAAKKKGMLAGVSFDEQCEIVNYDTSAAALSDTSVVPSGVDCDGNLLYDGDDNDAFFGLGSFSVPGLAALMGIFSLFRLGRKKDK